WSACGLHRSKRLDDASRGVLFHEPRGRTDEVQPDGRCAELHAGESIPHVRNAADLYESRPLGGVGGTDVVHGGRESIALPKGASPLRLDGGFRLKEKGACCRHSGLPSFRTSRDVPSPWCSSTSSCSSSPWHAMTPPSTPPQGPSRKAASSTPTA